MSRFPSLRWGRASVGMFGVCIAMLAASIATGVAHLGTAVSVTFGVLAVLCAIVAFVFIAIAASKDRAENQRLVAQALDRARRK